MCVLAPNVNVLTNIGELRVGWMTPNVGKYGRYIDLQLFGVVFLCSELTRPDTKLGGCICIAGESPAEFGSGYLTQMCAPTR